MVLGEPDAETTVRTTLVQRVSVTRNTEPKTFNVTQRFPSVAHELTALVEQYRPIVSFRRGSHVTIVIGRMDVCLSIQMHSVVHSRPFLPQAVAEIMEKGGGTMTDRPEMIAANILSGGMRLLLESSGDRFRRLRKAAHTHLQPKTAEKYEDMQAEDARKVVLDVLNNPKHHVQHAQRYVFQVYRWELLGPLGTSWCLLIWGHVCVCFSYAIAVMLRVTYGAASPTSSDDPEVVRVNQVLVNFQTVLRPGAYLVDRVPWLRHVPGYGRQLKGFHQFELALFRDQLNRVKEDMVCDRSYSRYVGASYPRFRQRTALAHHLARRFLNTLMITD